jgi:5-formyltetrahydrofolate cyclo-ligase
MSRDSGYRGGASGCYASPPCLMHELDAELLGFAPETDAQTRVDVMRWRKAKRDELIGDRMKTTAEERASIAAHIAEDLDALLNDVGGRMIGVYWPIRGEPDLRPWLESVRMRGGCCALPVVVRRAAPLLFRVWQPGHSLARGVWDIPVPATGAAVAPDIVIAPLVGFDAACYRLGYGGGYYDRTLAALAPRPRVIGVGAARAKLPTIYSQPYDIPMDAIVTERATMLRKPPHKC